MSETAELTRKIDALMEMATRTSQDVTWIKAGMEAGTERMDTLAKDHAALNNRVSKMQGSAGTIGAVAGAIFGGLITYFTRVHT